MNNKGDQDDCRTFRVDAGFTLHNALADNICPLETATAVKIEPPDVNDDVSSMDGMTNVKSEASYVRDEIWIKIEPLDVDNNVSPRASLGNNVNTEGSDVRDGVCPLDTAAVVKQEVDVEPTVLQSSNMKYIRLPCKHDAENNVTEMESHRLSKDNVNVTLKQDNSHMTGMCGVKYFCNTCNENFTLESVFQRPLLTHTGEEIYDICNTDLSQKPLKKNIYEHKKETSHSCNRGSTNDCGEHESHDGAICNKSSSNPRHLKNHMLTHAERTHRCDICSKNFSQERNLKRHILSHTGERPHCCAICDKTFFYQQCLKSHLLTHSGERPHCCHICNKTFSEKSTLKKHMLTHTGERPHRCDLCSKSFAQQSTLKHHMLTHTSEKSHCCLICNKVFSLPGNLKRHMSTNHKTTSM